MQISVSLLSESSLNLPQTKETIMTLDAVLEQLKAERAKLDRAIAALSGGRSSSGRRNKRTMSPAARRRIAAAQRARWAKWKAKKDA